MGWLSVGGSRLKSRARGNGKYLFFFIPAALCPLVDIVFGSVERNEKGKLKRGGKRAEKKTTVTSRRRRRLQSTDGCAEGCFRAYAKKSQEAGVQNFALRWVGQVLSIAENWTKILYGSYPVRLQNSQGGANTTFPGNFILGHIISLSDQRLRLQ